MTMKRKILLALVIVPVSILVVGTVAKWIWDARFYDGYEPGAPLNATIRSDEPRDDYRRVDLVYDGIPGHAVPTLLALPKEHDGPVPCVVFLHGIGQKKDFLDEIAATFTTAGYAIVCFDQYTRGERNLESTNWFTDMLALRTRASLNVTDTRRLLDYLLTRDDIDADRLYLVGASFGAITGTAAAAFDDRFKAAVLTYGGGNLRSLLSSDAAKSELGGFYWPAMQLGAFLLKPADPVRHAAGIAPRPVLIQNGTHDQLIPTEAAQALFDAAREPKEMVWYETDHIGLDEAHVMRVLGETIEWLNALPAE
ncbi:MAG: alpha/beta fold hydrolase [bacterium]|nr:alpha/beta fold hydrolase [bacterium]